MTPVYQTERWWMKGGQPPRGYRIPVANGRYRVILHFAEIFPNNARWPGRSLDAVIEGERVLQGLELFREHGWATAVSPAFDTEVSDDWLDITFESVRLDMKVNGIEVERIVAP